MAKLERYIKEKKLEINTSKTAIIRCRKGEGRRKKKMDMKRKSN